VPPFAAIDHRLFLDENGRDRRLPALPRLERRKIAAEVRKIASAYRDVVNSIKESGAGYPVDQLLRQFAFEYTYRYASAGLTSQPISFNYIEAFCDIRLIDGSVAPYTHPMPEIDHLFSINDYIDYITSPQISFNLSCLRGLPEGEIFHYTLNGSIFDFTFLSPEGREFVVAGFSLVRRGNFLHWYVLGGEVFSEHEWEERVADQKKIELGNISPYKRRFLSESMEKHADTVGSPIALEGTTTALRTIIAGETDLVTQKHLGLCCMFETEHNFVIICDDPDVFEGIADVSKRTEMIENMRDRIEAVGVMWSLAEVMFQLPAYFDFKVKIAKSIAVSEGQRLPKTVPKGGRGVRKHFRYVSAIEFTEAEAPVVRPIIAPHYKTETGGHWRRIPHNSYGRDADGNAVRGRTWIRAVNEWRERRDASKVIYVKSLISTAKIKLNEYLSRADEIEKRSDFTASQSNDLRADSGVLYVLRSTVMKDEVYKVGWTSGTAEQRAIKLSADTGVPSSFAVVASWKHPDPEGLEKGVHAMLAPYRINEAREFFQASFATIKSIIEAEIARTGSRLRV
jgi:hypothetical protein